MATKLKDSHFQVRAVYIFLRLKKIKKMESVKFLNAKLNLLK